MQPLLFSDSLTLFHPPEKPHTYRSHSPPLPSPAPGGPWSAFVLCLFQIFPVSGITRHVASGAWLHAGKCLPGAVLRKHRRFMPLPGRLVPPGFPAVSSWPTACPLRLLTRATVPRSSWDLALRGRLEAGGLIWIQLFYQEHLVDDVVSFPKHRDSGCTELGGLHRE